MNSEKRQKLEEAGWKVGSAEEFLELTEEEKAIVSKVVESEKFFRKWGVGKVSLKHLSQTKSPQEILEQHRKAYPKIVEFVKTYLNSTNKSNGKTY